MDVFPVNWDSVPEVMNKEHFFRICHISKSTALHLLKSGKVPCEWSGKKTRCYKIRKEDVKAYLEERAIFPELYSAPKGWYGTHYVARLSKELPEDTLRQMHGYYEKLLREYARANMFHIPFYCRTLEIASMSIGCIRYCVWNIPVLLELLHLCQ